ncbi:2OG-Fe(II) oxygenase [Alphaproteobacteria bacterium]|nr:2OG-Fe(II) oxygenase [Alphaproteobacteria bacterium]
METSIKQEYFVNKILQRLEDESEGILAQWERPEGTSTRHFFLDKFLPKSDVDEIYAAFPRNGKGFFDRESFREKKRESADLSNFNAVLSDITYAIQDPRVVTQIAELCSMNNLEPDPKLYAGGLSMMFPNDYLNPHIDNSHDRDRNKYRRLNLLHYVSPDWALDNGGNFELWDDGRATPKTIISHQNRFVVMETNKTSWHSVSQVNAERPRCCVSNYYFSENSPDGDEYFHVTSFLGRPNQRIRSYIGVLDNGLRNFVSRTLKIGRGKNLVNKDS